MSAADISVPAGTVINPVGGIPELTSDIGQLRAIPSLSRHLRASAVRALRAMDAYMRPEAIFREACLAKQWTLAWTIRQDMATRVMGRPHQAADPEPRRAADSEYATKIAVAIRNLQVVQPAALPGKPRRVSHAKLVRRRPIEQPSQHLAAGAATAPIQAAAKGEPPR